jgi:hypothetical protein
MYTTAITGTINSLAGGAVCSAMLLAVVSWFYGLVSSPETGAFAPSYLPTGQRNCISSNYRCKFKYRARGRNVTQQNIICLYDEDLTGFRCFITDSFRRYLARTCNGALGHE